MPCATIFHGLRVRVCVRRPPEAARSCDVRKTWVHLIE